MSICRTIFEKLFKKDIFEGMAKECESDNFDEIIADKNDVMEELRYNLQNAGFKNLYEYWLSTRPKLSLDERLNPRHRKYKAYLERCYK